MSSSSVVIASVGRTAVGSFKGAFGIVAAREFGAAAIKGALDRTAVSLRGRGHFRPSPAGRRRPESRSPGGDANEATAWRLLRSVELCQALLMMRLLEFW